MKVQKIEKVEFTLDLTREEMDALKEVAREWRQGETSRKEDTRFTSVGGPTEADKERVADMIIREGKATRGVN